MVSAETFIELALSFEGVGSKPHFDRTAFHTKRIFASLAPDRLSVNLMLDRDQQQFLCMMYPEAFSPVPNKWGEKGATTVVLAHAEADALRSALELAWQRSR